MIEQFLMQMGALGIVAYVVYDNKQVTNGLLKRIDITMSKVNDCLNKR